MKLYGYRLLESDDDGDPLDHGIVLADSEQQAADFVAAHLVDVLEDWNGTVRVYDHGAVATWPAGVLESSGFVDIEIAVGEEGGA